MILSSIGTECSAADAARSAGWAKACALISGYLRAGSMVVMAASSS